MIKKIICSIALMLMGWGALNAQTVSRSYCEAGIVFTGYFSDIDSLPSLVYYSSLFDLSLVDDQTLYFNYEFLSPGTTGDTITVRLQPVEVENGSSTVEGYWAPVAVDTVQIIGYAATSSISYSSSTVRQTTFPITKFGSKYRLIVTNTPQIINSRNNKSLRFSIYAKTNGYQPPFTNLGNH